MSESYTLDVPIIIFGLGRYDNLPIIKTNHQNILHNMFHDVVKKTGKNSKKISALI